MIHFGSLAILNLNQRNVLYSLQQRNHVKFLQNIETKYGLFQTSVMLILQMFDAVQSVTSSP